MNLNFSFLLSWGNSSHKTHRGLQNSIYLGQLNIKITDVFWSYWADATLPTDAKIGPHGLSEQGLPEPGKVHHKKAIGLEGKFSRSSKCSLEEDISEQNSKAASEVCASKPLGFLHSMALLQDHTDVWPTPLTHTY